MIDVGQRVHNFGRLHAFVRYGLRILVLGPQIHVVLLHHGRHVTRDDNIGIADFFDTARIQPHGAVADRFHFRDSVRYEENRYARRSHFMNFA